MAECKFSINDRRLAAWTVLDNAFTATKEELRAPRDQWFWNGILIQLGVYDMIEGGQTQGFDEISITAGGAVETILREQFINNQMWINIVAKASRQRMPFEVGHAYQLVPGDDRALRKHFHPYPGVITLWTENGYELDANPTDLAATRHSHDFKTNAADSASVEIYHKGVLHKKLENATDIKISTQGNIPPGNLNGPPV